MARRFLSGPVLAALVVLGLVLGGGAWWYRTTRPGYRLQRGQEAARAGDYDRAEHYASLLEADDRSDAFFLLRGEILFRQGDAKRALGTLNRIKDEGDLQLQAAVLSAQCLIALKNPREAERVLLYVLDRQPNHVDAHRWLAVIYYDQGDVFRAIPHLEKVAELDTKDGRPLRMLGVIYKDLDQPEEAVTAYRKSLRRQPRGPAATDIRTELAEVLLKRFQDSEALQALEGVESATASALRAEAMIPLGQISEATALLDDALKKYPDNGDLLRLRGERYRDANDPAAAAKLLERAMALDPHDFRSRNYLALCYEALGRSQEAAEQRRLMKETQALMEAIHERNLESTKNPWDPEVRFKLAELCEKMNRPQLAKMWRTAAEACQQK